MELTGSIKGTGRRPTPFEAEVIRELSEDDLLFRAATTIESKTPPIAKLRYQHHRLAQLLAGGMKPADCSILTGYSPSRISILQAAPAFAELISHYTSNNKEVYHDLNQRMAGIAMNASEELQERLDEKPETLTNKELLEVLKVTNDRGGNSPISRSISTTAIITTEELTRIREEVKSRENGRIIEASQAIESYHRVEVGETLLQPPANANEAPTLQGGEGKGEDV